MSQAIWTLSYAISDDDGDRYLDWFHGQHIPEKLARPGYDWASHYEHPVPGITGQRGYVAFFGGQASRVFFDPSPAQLRDRQDALTREMMGCRIAGRWVVYCEEWSAVEGEVQAPAMSIHCIDAAGRDEALQAWCVQQFAPALSGTPGVRGVRKWLAASNAPRHALVTEFDDRDVATPWPEMVEGVEQPYGPPCLATRIWPAP